MESQWLDVLRCPADDGPVLARPDAVRCVRCARTYPVVEGIVSFLSDEELTAVDRREQQSRDDESAWYDGMFEGYTNAVEVATVAARIGSPAGPILDHGAGTGRITRKLAECGAPVIAVDYSFASLRRLRSRVGDNVLAVQSDVRRLPLRTGSIAAAASIEVYEHIRGAGARIAVLNELARVLAPHGRLAISTFNFNAVFRLWMLAGNRGAREGEHLLGAHFYYRRQTYAEFERELRTVFAVERIDGIRTIPARSIAALISRAGAPQLGTRFLSWMTDRGYRLDHALEPTAVSHLTGLFWLAVVHNGSRLGAEPAPAADVSVSRR